jgi:hypothetical protein
VARTAIARSSAIREGADQERIRQRMGNARLFLVLLISIRNSDPMKRKVS